MLSDEFKGQCANSGVVAENIAVLHEKIRFLIAAISPCMNPEGDNVLLGCEPSSFSFQHGENLDNYLDICLVPNGAECAHREYGPDCEDEFSTDECFTHVKTFNEFKKLLADWLDYHMPENQKLALQAALIEAENDNREVANRFELAL